MKSCTGDGRNSGRKEKGNDDFKNDDSKKEEKAFFLFCRRDCAIMEQILLSFGLTVHILSKNFYMRYTLINQRSAGFHEKF